VAPEFSGDRLIGVAAGECAGQGRGKRAEFTWAALDGSAAYRISVERFDWLSPFWLAAWQNGLVPTRVEIVRRSQRGRLRGVFRKFLEFR